MPDYTQPDAPWFTFGIDRASTLVSNTTLKNQLNDDTELIALGMPSCLYVSAESDLVAPYTMLGWRIKFAAEVTLQTQRDRLLALVIAYTYVAPVRPPRSQFDAVRDPLASDDATQGFSEASRWYNAITNREFICTDATAGFAVWTVSQMQLLQAIVRGDGLGTHVSLADAIASGIMSIQLEVGVHTVDTLLTIPSRTTIQGNGLGGSFLRLTGQGALRADGSAGQPVTNTGTISIVSGSSLVTGTGTTWVTDGVQPGQYVEVGPTFLQIASVDSATQLTLVSVYAGRTRTNVTYWVQSMAVGIFLSNVIVYNDPVSPTSQPFGMHLKACRNSAITQISVSGFGTNLWLEDCGQMFVVGGVIQNAISTGLLIDNCLATCCHTMGFLGCQAYGVRVIESENLICSQLSINSNACGFSVESNSSYVRIDAVLQNNATHGVALDGTTHHCTVTRCTFRGNGSNAISLQGSAHSIEHNTCTGQGSHSLLLQNAVDCVVGGNHCSDSGADGICLDTGCHRNVLTSNHCRSSVGYGLHNVHAANANQLVANNVAHTNTAGNWLDNGLTSVVANNQFV